ncbi:MAG: hypothetical protein HWD61_11995 [Parachlamydiaceae bacterium]|nr:MAG: hypothetical protein HWD61_11995 [Parachlamydiaceae bacterium]
MQIGTPTLEKHFSLSKQENIDTKGAVWKTAIKIATYVLSALILPILALVAKAAYKNWVMKNTGCNPGENFKQTSLESKLVEPQNDPHTVKPHEVSEDLKKEETHIETSVETLTEEVSIEESKPNPEKENLEKFKSSIKST